MYVLGRTVQYSGSPRPPTASCISLSGLAGWLAGWAGPGWAVAGAGWERRTERAGPRVPTADPLPSNSIVAGIPSIGLPRFLCRPTSPPESEPERSRRRAGRLSPHSLPF
ncbi:hypothetical protein GQ53DRAFT_458580 [Thozetella sp. PMI_491]|nr:hypothetical protein GQ53DRAFT_458580 [Thozetella sp. PMI_491]